MTMSKGCGLVIAVLAVTLAPLGCGSDEDSTTDAPAAKASAPSPKPNATNRPKSVERSDAPREARGSLSGTGSDDGLETISELPKNFPSDVPVYPGSVPTESLVSSEDDLTVSFTTSGSSAEVVQFYLRELKKKGWKIFTKDEQDQLGMIIANKGGRSATILMMPTPTGSHVTVTMSTE